MKSPIEITIDSYNKTADAYAKNVENLFLEEEIEKFLSYLPKASLILDAGCGSGRDAKLFTGRGYNVIGIDLSDKLLKIASKNAPKAEFKLMDITNLDFPEDYLDGVWSNASLLHILKSEIPKTLDGIYKNLKKDGILFICTKEGTGEAILPDQRYDGLEKFWSLFQMDELESYLGKYTILESYFAKSKSSYNTVRWINIFCRK
jgi:SAM-dependent methyltransferase